MQRSKFKILRSLQKRHEKQKRGKGVGYLTYEFIQ